MSVNDVYMGVFAFIHYIHALCVCVRACLCACVLCMHFTVSVH